MSLLNTSDLYRIFISLDRNNDGYLSLSELKCLLESIEVHATLDELFGKSSLNFQEFIRFYDSMFIETAMKNTSHRNQIGKQEEDKEESDLYKAFKVFDLNGDGLISPQELQSVLCKLGRWDNTYSTLDCARIIHEYDVNSDGFVDYDEFKRMMLAH